MYRIKMSPCMIPFRGLCSGKCYEASKPIKWGAKIWKLCCAALSQGMPVIWTCGRDKDLEDLSLVNNSAAVVIKLCQSLWGKGYHVLSDRYYSSPNLLHWLRSLNMSGTGTCMTNSKGFSKPLVKSTTEARRLEQGQYEWMQCHNTGITAT